MRAEAAVAFGRRALAESCLERIAALEPKQKGPRLSRIAALYLKLKRHEQALELLDEAVRRSPGDVKAWILRAGAAVSCGRRALARRSLERAAGLERTPAQSRQAALLERYLGRSAPRPKRRA